MAIIGDVHGQIGRLDRALTRLAGDRFVVMVGDYINRGPSSSQVLDRLVAETKRNPDGIALIRGNHEAALLGFLETGRPENFLRHHGATTIRSYIDKPGPDVIEEFRLMFPNEHLELLKATRTHIEDSSIFVSHAGFNPRDVSSRSMTDLTLGHWPELLDSSAMETPRPLAVFGHYASTAGTVTFVGSRICVDAGCGTYADAPLAALLIPELRVEYF